MVLVTFRTVQSKIYKMELPPETTIGQAKERYAQEHCEGEAANIKMIFKARMLQNDVTIGSLNLGEKDFIVVHAPKAAAKPAAQPTPAPEAQTPPQPTVQPLPTPQQVPEPQPLPVTNPAPTTASPGGFPGTVPNFGGAPAGGSEFNTDSPEFQQNVTSLMELGFPKEECEAALRAAYGNSDRAAEYLFSGNIPEPEERENDDNLVNSFRVMQASLLLEPRALENFVEMMESSQPMFRTNPELLLQRFGNLPQDKFDLEGIRNRTVQPISRVEFEQLQVRAAQSIGLIPGGPAQPGFGGPAQPGFGGPAPQPGFGGPTPQPGFGGQAPQPGFAPGPGGPAPGGPRPGLQGAEAMLASLPQEDQEAIRRLQQLGNFNLLEVIQIYQACDKNENQAANILFSNQE